MENIVNMEDIEINKKLINIAIENAKNAYAPYSSFVVSVALLTKNNNIYVGVNIENASYSATICAERSAIANAISNGEREFQKLAIVGGKNGEFTEYCYPCGICRQVLAEFCDGNFEIICGRSGVGEYEVHTLASLLPKAFEKGRIK